MPGGSSTCKIERSARERRYWEHNQPCITNSYIIRTYRPADYLCSEKPHGFVPCYTFSWLLRRRHSIPSQSTLVGGYQCFGGMSSPWSHVLYQHRLMSQPISVLANDNCRRSTQTGFYLHGSLPGLTNSLILLRVFLYLSWFLVIFNFIENNSILSCICDPASSETVSSRYSNPLHILFLIGFDYHVSDMLIDASNYE